MGNKSTVQEVIWDLDPLLLDEQIKGFLREDIGYYDLTATITINKDLQAKFFMNAREAMVIAGMHAAARVFTLYDDRIKVLKKVADGEHVQARSVLMEVSGPARSILTAERTSLNLIQRMSGIATMAARYVTEIKGTKAQLIDSRKTTPGLRMLEKHAIVCGGGRNHRLGLGDGVMLKDNHIAVCGGIKNAVGKVKATIPVLTKIEVECDRYDQVVEALAAGADVIMLDNMTLDEMRRCVAYVAGRTTLEASGGIRLETIRAIAETGVDLISVGRIAQSSPALDIGLDDKM